MKFAAMRPFPRLIYLLFFLSGASSLIFETLWQRMMYLVFGASAPAATAILTAFFCGIAAGSWIGGKLLVRSRNPILFYAAVEFWIGVWGLAVPLLLHLAEWLYVTQFHDAEPGILPRFLLAIAVVLPATLGMGATVPVMNRILSDFGKGVGGSVGLAYGVNTIGAVAGTLLTGFVLIRALGVQNTLYVAASLNALVVAGSLALRRHGLEQWQTETGPVAPLMGKQLVLLMLYFTAGFLALGFEVTWFRLLSIFCVSSVTTFTLILSTYLLGFSTGSLLMFPWLNRRMPASAVFVLSLWGSGVSALAGLSVIYGIPDVTLWLLLDPLHRGTLTSAHIILSELLASGMMMFVPTVFMGLAYPAICQLLIASGSAIGRQSGRFYFWGTWGSMAGAFVVGLTLIPGLGLVKTYGLLCVLSLLAAAAATRLASDLTFRLRGFFHVSGAAAIACGAAYMIWGHPFVKTGRLVRQSEGVWAFVAGEGGPIEQRLLLSYRVGRSATISVEEERYHTLPGEPPRVERTILVDGQDVASSHADALVDSKMLAHLPLLLHPRPRNALTVGFGSGGTSWSMTCHGIETYCVEIEPMVAESAGFFEDQNHGVVKHPDFRLILNDARDHLHLTGRRYDVISTDVTNLQYKQNGSLYTQEYFRLMKDRLADGGVACAWIPMGAISEADFRTLIRSFLAVYPHTTLWYMNHQQTGFAILIGTPEALAIDMHRLEQGFADPRIRSDLEIIGVTSPIQFVHALYLDAAGVRNYVGDGPLHTDDRPILEFSSPVSHYYKNRAFLENLQKSLSYRPADLSQFVVNLGGDQRPLFERHAELATLFLRMNVASHRYMINYEIAASPTVMAEQPLERMQALHAMRESLREGAACGREAVRLFPDDAAARKRLDEFNNLLRSLPPEVR